MAVWLWVTGLAPKNDWIELNSFSLGSGARDVTRGNDVRLALDPGPFRSPLYSWFFKGTARSAYVFVDPQTEYHFTASIPTGISTSGNSTTMLINLNYEKIEVTYSGAP